MTLALRNRTGGSHLYSPVNVQYTQHIIIIIHPKEKYSPVVTQLFRTLARNKEILWVVTMVVEEVLYHPQNELVEGSQPTPCSASADDDMKRETDSDRKPGDVAFLEKEVAVNFVSLVLSLMVVSQIAPMQNTPKSDKYKEQTRNKETAENRPLMNALQTPCDCKPEKNAQKKSPKKKKPKHSKKKNIAQTVSTNDSSLRYCFRSPFSFVSSSMNGLIGNAIVSCNNFSNSCMIRILLYLVLFAFAGHVVLSAPAELEIDQAFPSQCKNTLEESRQCPNFKSEYDDLNQACCGIVQGKVLHCLSHFDENKNKEILSVACLSDTEVEPGYVINITFNNGSPQKGLIPCEAGNFEPDHRNSSKIRHPYCHKSKIQCSGEDRRQLFCNGGTARDDQCMCMPGFEPRSWNTSQSHCASTDICHCVKAQCPPSQKRNIDYMYNQSRQCPKEISINYSCVDIETTAELLTVSPTMYDTIGNGTTENPIKRDSNATLKPVTPSNNETSNQDLLYMLLLIPIIALLVIVLVLYKWKIKKIGSYYFHKIKPTNNPFNTPAVDLSQV